MSLAPKARLLAVSRAVEARALVEPSGAQVWACLQRDRFLTSQTLAVYSELAASGVEVHLIGLNEIGWPAGPAGVWMHDLAPNSPLAQEWNVLLLTGRRGWGLFARDNTPGPPPSSVPDRDRIFSWAVSEERELIAHGCAWLRELLDLHTSPQL